ncbi:MAG: CRISPR system precrRNA processing endoribonuclease RAMP protein Cas6 [Bacteroidota bacterium]
MKQQYPLPLEHLTWRTIKLTYQLTRAGRLPHFKSALWRGILGHVLLEKSPLLYEQIFECKLPPDHPYSRRFQHAPSPYLVSIHDNEPRTVQSGEELIVYLTLIGKAIDHFSELIPLLQDMDRRAIGPDWIPLQMVDLSLLETEEAQIWLPPKPPADLINLRFQSPLHVKGVDRNYLLLPLSLLIHRLAERMSLLAYFHCDAPFVSDFSDLKEKAATARILSKHVQWREWPRFSSRKYEKFQKGGLMGSISYGEVHPHLLPLLRLGTHLHVGKGTAWGMGRMSLEE